MILIHPLVFDPITWLASKSHSWTVSAAIEVFDQFPDDQEMPFNLLVNHGCSPAIAMRACNLFISGDIPL